MKALVSLLLALASLVPVVSQVTAVPVGAAAITRIAVAQDEVTVSVWVPAGQRRVTLESRPKLGRGNWTPRDLKWTDGLAGEITFKLPAAAAEAELLRVREESATELDLPPTFFKGVKTFAPVIQNPSAGGFRGGVNSFDTPGLGAVVFNSTITDSAGTPGPTRAVVESDIWKVDGNTIYFFNQQRGLQVIDVTHPDAPALRGSLALADWGEQMYRLPADTGDGTIWLALLTQSGCDGNSEVVLVAVRNGQPSLQGRVPLAGSVRESRLVGDVIYTASFTWFQPPPEPDPSGTGLVYRQGEPRTTVAGIDLADPRQPGVRAAVELAAMPNAISATDRWLFVATTGSRTPAPNERLAAWAVAGNQAVIAFDISDQRGEVRQAGALLTAGRVDSKFKLGLNGEVLTVVSEAGNTSTLQPVVDPATGQVTEQWTWQPPRAVLETFSLAEPNQPARLAELTLVQNQQVHGTRFEGNRVYVVTFLRVDPLWIVDLSDPEKPVVQGKLEVPGWSNYLHPLGDQLLAVGVEGGRAALSLFDVKDAAKPGLLSKVLLGEGWSWTEANNDEKALAVLPEAGLLLVPWSGQKPTQVNGWFSGMQLVDYDRAARALKARGVINHSFPARRATLIGDRVVSLAGDAVLTADISDRDQPKVRGELPLSHQVDRVFVAGDRLVQLAYYPTPRVVLTRTTEPEAALATLPLLSLPVIGADVRDGRLYLLQHQPETFRYDEIRTTNEVVTTREQPPKWIWITNLVVTAQPQPPLTNLTQVWRTIEVPPLPDTPGYKTNKWVWRMEIVPQPDVLVTNPVVRMELAPQPPVVETNVFVNSEWRAIPIPAESAFSVVAWTGDRLEIVGQDQRALPAGLSGFNLDALWTDGQTLVWTERSSVGGGWGPSFAIPARPARGNLSISFAALNTDVMNPIGIFPGPWWNWWGTSARNLLAFDVGTAEPKLVSAERLTSTNGWTQFSAAFVADGKVFVSERSTENVSDPTLPKDGTGLTGTLWQNTYRLHVVDFADPADPVVRPPTPLPADLAGVSHAGQLVYALRDGQPAWGEQAAKPAELLALAYDGISASLVDSLPIGGMSGAQPMLVRANGQILLTKSGATVNETPVIEAWAVSGAGKFDKYGSLPVSTAVGSFQNFGDVVVATTGDSFLFLSAGAPNSLSLLGAAERPCSLWSDLTTADATAGDGLWLARGAYGLWHAPRQP